METENPQLKIEDLRILREIVELSVQRGAFAANEIAAVGAAYDKLNNFLVHVQAAEEQTRQETENASPPAPADAEGDWEVPNSVPPASSTTTAKKKTSKGE